MAKPKTTKKASTVTNKQMILVQTWIPKATHQQVRASAKKADTSIAEELRKSIIAKYSGSKAPKSAIKGQKFSATRSAA